MKNSLVSKCKKQLPNTRFVRGNSFYWSPKRNSIYYDTSLVDSAEGSWALLHEMGHAISNHQGYSSDLELVKLEVGAWEAAKSIGNALGITIDHEHIEDCLDSYRDWLHKRSTCPTCGNVSVQINSGLYRCHNCYAEWTVSTSKFCRSYRMKNSQQKETSSVSVVQQTTFQ